MTTTVLSKNTNKDHLGRQLRERRVPAGWVHDEVCTCTPDHHVHVWQVVCPRCGTTLATLTKPGSIVAPRHAAWHATMFCGAAPTEPCPVSDHGVAARLVKHGIFG